MGKQKRGKIPQVSSFGRVMNSNGKISTPAFRKNSNVAQVMIYGKKHYVHVLVCHTFHGPPTSEAEQELLHKNQHSEKMIFKIQRGHALVLSNARSN